MKECDFSLRKNQTSAEKKGRMMCMTRCNTCKNKDWNMKSKKRERRFERRRGGGMFGIVEAPDCKKVEQEIVKRCNTAFDNGMKAMESASDAA
jgi:hypothetical protein